MVPNIKNLFADVPACESGESVAHLFENDAIKIERIVSHSHSSPEGFWYDQANDEWVILLSGSASLEFSDGRLIDLSPGDYLTILAHVKHRIAQTSAQATWLAVHVK